MIWIVLTDCRWYELMDGRGTTTGNVGDRVASGTATESRDIAGA